MSCIIPAPPLPPHAIPTPLPRYLPLYPGTPRNVVDSDSTGNPLPAHCTVPNCMHAGRPHRVCQQARSQQHRHNRGQSYHYTPRQRVGVLDSLLTDVDPTEQNAYLQWLYSRPNWHIPQQRPAGWSPPPGFRRGLFAAAGASIPPPQTPNVHHHRRHVSAPDVQGPVPAVVGPPGAQGYRHTDGPPGTNTAIPAMLPASDHPSPRSPTHNLPDYGDVDNGDNGNDDANDEMPQRTPDRVQWDGVAGGRLTWTPSQRAAAAAAQADACQSPSDSWQAPTPGAQAGTGGQPLPGTQPLWTPGAWNPALFATDLPRGEIQLAPWLVPNPRSTVVPHMLWDVAEPSSRIKRLTHRQIVVDFANTQMIRQQATFPPANEIHLYVPGMRKSWGPIIISNRDPIEVGHIFDALHDFLQVPLNTEDMRSLLNSGEGDAKFKRVEFACYRRCNRSLGLSGVERKQGLKRVDVLEGNTMFWGMWPNYRPDGTWYLSVAFSPQMA